VVSGDRVSETAESIGFVNVGNLGKSKFGGLEEGRIVDIS